MATGRARLLQQHWLGVQALRLPLGGVGATPGSGGFRKGPGVQSAAPRAPLRQQAPGDGHRGRPSPRCPVLLDSLPSEILLKILSYLDAATLLCMGCVNRRFYHLANDNFIWIRIYSAAFSPKRCNWRADSAEKAAASVSSLSVEDKEAGFWKREYIAKRIASVKAALAQVLKLVNPYTGLPAKTKEALRISGLGWVIILKGKSGQEQVLEHAALFVNDSSVTVVWYGKNWPCLATLSTLDLCGVTPVFTDRSKPPARNGPRWPSLVAKYNLSNLTDSTLVGCDRFVRIFHLNPGLLVGLWKRAEELAFVMANLHFHHLVERSTLGSATIPYELPAHSPLLDDSPEYGLHGYQLHMDMHSSGTFHLCSTFRSLFTEEGSHQDLPGRVPGGEGYIENGYVKLVVIHFQNSNEHLPLIGKVGLSWRTDIFDGCVKSCSVMDVTLLDEYGKPFWCFSSPVCMRSSPSPSDGPHFVGPTYCIDYEDPAGRVHVELVWIEETEEYFMVSLVLYLSVAKINRWFGTQY